MNTQRGDDKREGRKGWLASIFSRGSDPGDRGVEYELVVIEGADARATFAIDRPEIQIGRAIPGSESSAGIQLTDRSVSSKHALLSLEDGRITIQHLPSATNPTLVNGRRIKSKRKRIRDGDRIVLGLAVLELRARTSARARAPDQAVDRAADRAPQAGIETDPLNVLAELVLREGIDDQLGKRFPLARRRTAIGRDEDCEIVLEAAAVSRHHAALVWENDQLVLIHESAVNPTHVNGMRIKDRRRLFHGDEVRISESVAFEVVLQAASASGKEASPADRSAAARAETRLTNAHALPVAEAEATRVDEAPDLLEVSDPEATRVFEVPAADRPQAAALDGEATRIAPAPNHITDDEKTMIRPIPFAQDQQARETTTPERYRDAARTRVVDLDIELAKTPDTEDDSESRTLLRPSPSFEGDTAESDTPPPDGPVSESAKTVIRKAPQRKSAPAGETVVFEPDEDET